MVAGQWTLVVLKGTWYLLICLFRDLFCVRVKLLPVSSTSQLSFKDRGNRFEGVDQGHNKLAGLSPNYLCNVERPAVKL